MGVAPIGLLHRPSPPKLFLPFSYTACRMTWIYLVTVLAVLAGRAIGVFTGV